MPVDLPIAIHQRCREILGAELLSVQAVSGGDISQAGLLETTKGRFFIKINKSGHAAQMFGTEARSLQLLAQTCAIRTPEVLATGETEEGAFLLLSYVESGYRPAGFWEKFGTALAALHRHTAPQFGLDFDNFIGSLPQSNRRHDTWAGFYIHERLQPQLNLAAGSSLLQPADLQRFELFFAKMPDLCPAEPPALIHGDLWSGNFLADAAGEPVLADPAVCFAHREMDLAMSRLFGGFDRPFYRSYEEAFPLEPGFEQRLPVYQLYYLLVHVNLFGGGYVGAVRKVLKDFV